MGNVIRGTKFNYSIDTEYGINHDGFIAEGTESIVFKGVKYGNDLRYSCALKFKPKSRLQSFREREYKILESMQTCRSVVRVLDVIEDIGDFSIQYDNGNQSGEITSDFFFCVVEEYIDGDSLQDYCIKQWYEYNTAEKKWKRNSTKYTYHEIVKYQNQIVQFMLKFSEIMEFVSNVNSSNGKDDTNMPIILHCDIKPENIMVTKHGKDLVIIDFGRSQAITEGRTYQHYNDSENMSFCADYSDSQWQDVGKNNFYSYGTVGYAAPECYARPSRGVFPFMSQDDAFVNGCISIESDIFAFGATFFECLSIYEICTDIFKKEEGSSDPYFFKKAINKQFEDNVRSGRNSEYCDRDFRHINVAYHESLEKIIRKCTGKRQKGFQQPAVTADEYYHNFYQLHSEIETARDSIPSLDRKSDPLVRNSFGVAGVMAGLICTVMTICGFLKLTGSYFAQRKIENIIEHYNPTKIERLEEAAVEKMESSNESEKHEIYNKVYDFLKEENDCLDYSETVILVELLKHMEDAEFIDDSVDSMLLDVDIKALRGCVENTVTSLTDCQCTGYQLAVQIYNVQKRTDLLKCYAVLKENMDNECYRKLIVRLAQDLNHDEMITRIAESSLPADVMENGRNSREYINSMAELRNEIKQTLNYITEGYTDEDG